MVKSVVSGDSTDFSFGGKNMVILQTEDLKKAMSQQTVDK